MARLFYLRVNKETHIISDGNLSKKQQTYTFLMVTFSFILLLKNPF